MNGTPTTKGYLQEGSTTAMLMAIIVGLCNAYNGLLALVTSPWAQPLLMSDTFKAAFAGLIVGMIQYRVTLPAPVPTQMSGPVMGKAAPALVGCCLAAMLLAGCSAMPWYSQAFSVMTGLEMQAVTDTQRFNDEVLKTQLDLVCRTPIGAVGRIGPTDPISRNYLLQHCGIVSTMVLTGGPGSAVFMGSN